VFSLVLVDLRVARLAEQSDDSFRFVLAGIVDDRAATEGCIRANPEVPPTRIPATGRMGATRGVMARALTWTPSAAMLRWLSVWC